MENNNWHIDDILRDAVKNQASDIHLSIGMAPIVRIAGVLRPLEGYQQLTDDDLKVVLTEMLNETKIEKLYQTKESDSSYEISSKERFRVNIFFQKDKLAFSIRFIPSTIPTLEILNLPSMYYEYCKLRSGLIIVAGSSGVGKSTTLAAMLNWINTNRNTHVITIEDPVEFAFESNKSLIQQREMALDTNSFGGALRSALRQDADIIYVGETRDLETLELAVKAAETGHLVLTTLHAYSTVQAIEGIIGMYPENRQAQARMQLSVVLEGLFIQTLVQGVDKSKRYPAVEILVATDAVKNTIREGNTHYLSNIISTNIESGMQTLERSLAELVNKGLVTLDDAIAQSRDPKEVVRHTKGQGK